jgi:hypothetical protein
MATDVIQDYVQLFYLSKGLKGKVFTWGSRILLKKVLLAQKYLIAIYEETRTYYTLVDFART